MTPSEESSLPHVAKPRRHGSGWQINWRDGTGKRRFKSFGTHREAVHALHKKKSEQIEARQNPSLAVCDYTFDDLAVLWVRVKHHKRSLRDDEGRLRVHLLPAFGSLSLKDISPSRIALFERDLSTRVSVGTVRLVLALLRSMLRLAVEDAPRATGAGTAFSLS